MLVGSVGAGKVIQQLILLQYTILLYLLVFTATLFTGRARAIGG